MDAPTPSPLTQESEPTPLANKFVSIMEKIGQDIKLVWSEVIKYLPAAANLASLLFPGVSAAAAGVVNSVDLIQQAVVTVEQKFAAAGVTTGTGAQKLAQVVSMVGPTVAQLLAAEKIIVTPDYLNSIISAVVAVLNAQGQFVSA